MDKAFFSYNIHPATVEDIPAIRQIAVFTWWSVYPAIISADQIEYMLDALYNEDVLKQNIYNNDQSFLVLTEDDVPEAFASYGDLENDPEGIKLFKIYVLPQKHFKGFGKALISRIVEIAKGKGKKFLELNVNRQNPAKIFYEKMGFKVVEEVDLPIGPFFMNDFIMRLDFGSEGENS